MFNWFKKKATVDEAAPYAWSTWVRAERCIECDSMPRVHFENRSFPQFPHGVCHHCGSIKVIVCVAKYKQSVIYGTASPVIIARVYRFRGEDQERTFN